MDRSDETVRDWLVRNRECFTHELHGGDRATSFVGTLVSRVSDDELHDDEYFAFSIGVATDEGLQLIDSIKRGWFFVQGLDADDEVVNHVVDAIAKSAILTCA